MNKAIILISYEMNGRYKNPVISSLELNSAREDRIRKSARVLFNRNKVI
jgi:hypothetical protein